MLEQIRVISNLETNDAKLLQIVLVGQLNLLDVLAAADMRQLDQRISLRAVLKPLTREEVEAYIAHRLWVANGADAVRFDSDAVDTVHAISGGIPRVINLLCDRALMVGADLRVNVVTPAIIEEAAVKLGITSPAVAAQGAGRARARLGARGRRCHGRGDGCSALCASLPSDRCAPAAGAGLTGPASPSPVHGGSA